MFSVSLIFFSSANNAIAVGGTYFCSYDNSKNKCAVVSNCDLGHHGDVSFCSQFDFNSVQCISQTSHDCLIDFTPPTTSASDVTCTATAGGTGINTAIGCIPINSQSALVGFILKWAVGIGGGIAFILILIAGFQIITSRGDPKRLQAGQELLTSAIAGLLMLIFSLIILRVIGVDILGVLK